MKDEITEIYYSADPICEEGRMFLADRFLSLRHAHRMGVCSRDGIMYFMYTLNGEIVRWKARSMQDKKKQFMSKLSKDEASSFKMPFFSHFKDPSCDYIIITEGEFDCIALSQLGALNCVSLPNGSGSVESAFRSHYEFLQQFSKIYIAFDMDQSGEKAAKAALGMISPNKYRRVCFPCKDANDWIKNDPSLDLKDLEFLLHNSRHVENACLTAMIDLPDHFYDPIDLGKSSGWDKLDEMIGGVRTGEVIVLSADTGSGKSTFCFNLFKNLSEEGVPVWINSYEMDPRMTNRKLASIVLQKTFKVNVFNKDDVINYKTWLKQHCFYLNVTNTIVDVDVLRKQFELAAYAYGVKYILIDHLDYVYSQDNSRSKLENLDHAVKTIHALAMEFKVGVVLVVHPKQTEYGKEISMNHLKGSSSIKQYADIVIIITRMDRLDENDKLRVKVNVAKNRLLGKEGSFYLRYVPATDGYTESVDMFNPSLEKFKLKEGEYLC